MGTGVLACFSFWVSTSVPTAGKGLDALVSRKRDSCQALPFPWETNIFSAFCSRTVKLRERWPRHFQGHGTPGALRLGIAASTLALAGYSTFFLEPSRPGDRANTRCYGQGCGIQFTIHDVHMESITCGIQDGRALWVMEIEQGSWGVTHRFPNPRFMSLLEEEGRPGRGPTLNKICHGESVCKNSWHECWGTLTTGYCKRLGFKTLSKLRAREQHDTAWQSSPSFSYRCPTCNRNVGRRESFGST